MNQKEEKERETMIVGRKFVCNDCKSISNDSVNWNLCGTKNKNYYCLYGKISI